MHYATLQVQKVELTWQCMQQRQLQAFRQACGEALYVQLWCSAPLWLQEYLRANSILEATFDCLLVGSPLRLDACKSHVSAPRTPAQHYVTLYVAFHHLLHNVTRPTASLVCNRRVLTVA